MTIFNRAYFLKYSSKNYFEGCIPDQEKEIYMMVSLDLLWGAYFKILQKALVSGIMPTLPTESYGGDDLKVVPPVPHPLVV